MACPKCDYHAMRFIRGHWECKSPTCDYREGRTEKCRVQLGNRGPDVFMKDPAVTQKELVRVHDMPMEDVIRASGRGR